MPEQETKANLHIRSFVRLAEALDRILVISNVGISRVRACTTFSPSFYYNLKLLQEMFPNAKFITQKEYELWVDNQSEKIVAEHFLFNALRNITLNDYEGPQQHGPNGLYKTFTIANSSSIYYKKRMNFIKHYKTCPYDLKLNKLNLTKLKEVRLFRSGVLTKSVEKREMFSKFLTKALESDSQVLLISSNFRQPLFPDMREPIPYAEHILNEASKITDRLESSYIAIHWRMEQTRSANLPGCAKELVRTINEIKKNTRIKNVYLATDFPISYNKNGSIINTEISNVMKTQSDTFSDITAQHIRAMNILTSSIEGPGVQGILDKLVCINSNYFLSGPRGCCRISSGFTKQIAVSRTQLLIEGNPNILNTITRWSAKSNW
ncbi:3818_t:CDS:2 [Entrophospora sp. SA101]|nr:3818_t:CDS:2 [Entrophospora sp. SA101]CAJ0846528.1 7104_t:CDS:2 [Entrophospora sp. SA101]CAJ0846542.1 7109_t:CDS:2 [Entrophospora sp. SA101]CAJ0846554.1 7113_t:CDS:2 [Entrophospora sp. SA101]